MIVGVTRIGLKSRVAELRIGFDEIFRKTVIPKHGAVDVDRYIRKSGVDSAGLAVVQHAQRIRKRDIVAVRQIVPQRTGRGGAQMQGSGLGNIVQYRPDCSETGAGDVNALEHPVQQLRLTSIARRIESFFQSIKEE